MYEMEQRFLLLQSIDLDSFESHMKDEAAIKTDDEGNDIAYRIDVLWYYLYEMKVPGTEKRTFGQLFRLVRVVLTIVHSNAEEESLFSRVKKNLTPQEPAYL